MSSAPRFTDGWDEAYAAPGRPRSAYGPLLRRLEAADPPALKADVTRRITAAGARFGPAPLGVCPIPRLIEGGEWAALEAGLVQRVRALSAFVEDAYGAREIVTAGIVPVATIEDAEGYEPELHGRWPNGAAPLGVAGLDVVRDPDGELLVLEDNLRTPSGFAYAVVTREAVAATLSALPADEAGPMPSPVPLASAVVAALRATLLDAAEGVRERTGAARRGPPCVVVLTEGPASAAFFEHETAARWLAAPLVTCSELQRRGEELWIGGGSAGEPRPVDAVYRRTDSDRLRDEGGELTPAAELLLEPWLAGRLAVVNGFGTGVADDKLAHAYVERMIGFYLHEEPLLRSVETLDLNDRAELERVLADIRGHVIKPRHGQGGHGVVVCAHASETDVARIEHELRQPGAGAHYVAQATLALSLLPTVVGERIEPRHVDLRPFAFGTRDGTTVIPGGLTRVAWNADALVVNSSQDGGAKDTWVLP
jgi:uncharacterized circularly permuted ATP-grasp superfamily protein